MNQNTDSALLENDPGKKLLASLENPFDKSKQPGTIHRDVLRAAIFVLPVLIALFGYLWSKTPALQVVSVPDEPTPLGILPAEFENHDALLLSWPVDEKSLAFSYPQPDREKIQKEQDQIVLSIIAATCQNLEIVCLVNDERTQKKVQHSLRANQIPLNRVRFIRGIPINLWTRDFGPKILKAFDGSYISIDTDYFRKVGLDVSSHIPSLLARNFGMKNVYLPMIFEGGNLLSNGSGLCLITNQLHEDNLFPAHSDKVSNIFRKYYGATEVIILEPLEQEGTRHVDMFATFTAPDTVVIGKCSSELDPVNAGILDRNAKRLSGIKTSNGPLKVVRIPLIKLNRLLLGAESADEKLWYSYTNVVYANGILLVPNYTEVDPIIQNQAMDLYRRLLPGWKIIGIDSDILSRHGGALHCITSNLLFNTYENPSHTEFDMPVL